MCECLTQWAIELQKCLQLMTTSLQLVSMPGRDQDTLACPFLSSLQPICIIWKTQPKQVTLVYGSMQHYGQQYSYGSVYQYCHTRAPSGVLFSYSLIQDISAYIEQAVAHGKAVATRSRPTLWPFFCFLLRPVLFRRCVRASSHIATLHSQQAVCNAKIEQATQGKKSRR